MPHAILLSVFGFMPATAAGGGERGGEGGGGGGGKKSKCGYVRLGSNSVYFVYNNKPYKS